MTSSGCQSAGLALFHAWFAGAWMQVLGRLDALRKSSGLSRVFTEYISGEDLFGLNEPAIRRVIESVGFVVLILFFLVEQKLMFPLHFEAAWCGIVTKL